MKILYLTNSNSIQPQIAESERRMALVSRGMEQVVGEPVEGVIRPVWPTKALPRAVDRWMEAERPDMVYLQVIAFWFTYESVPIRLEKMLGPLGRPVRSLGIKASQTPWIGHNDTFHNVRQWAQRHIGGASFFTPEQVVETISESIRIIVRYEDSLLVVKGPRGGRSYQASEEARQRADARRLIVHRDLKALCSELHVDYVGSDVPVERVGIDYLGDNLHAGPQSQRVMADEILSFLAAAWERHRSLSSASR